MSLETKGILVKIFDTVDIKADFKKREFVIETEEKYPQLIKFELIQDDCGLIDGFATGDNVKVEFNLRGREWNEKFFTNLHAWRITSLGTASNTPPVDNPPIMDLPEGDDDMPF